MTPLGAKSTNSVVDHDQMMWKEADWRSRAGVKEMVPMSCGWWCCEARRALTLTLQSAKADVEWVWKLRFTGTELGTNTKNPSPSLESTLSRQTTLDRSLWKFLPYAYQHIYEHASGFLSSCASGKVIPNQYC